MSSSQGQGLVSELSSVKMVSQDSEQASKKGEEVLAPLLLHFSPGMALGKVGGISALLREAWQ